jgi:hypothetical protein
MHPLFFVSSTLKMRTFRFVETSGIKCLLIHPLLFGSSTLKVGTFCCVETSGTKYLVMHPLFFGSSDVDDENILLCRNLGNQISCYASSLLQHFDLQDVTILVVPSRV